MAQILTYESYEITSAGGVISFDITQPTQIYRLYTTSAVVLLADASFNFVGTPTLGMSINIIYEGGVATGAGYFVFINGNSIGAQQLNSVLLINLFYNGSSWDFTILNNGYFGSVPNINGKLIIPGTLGLANDPYGVNTIAVNKLVDAVARGYALRAGASGVWESFNAVAAGQLLLGDGTDLTSQAMSGHVHINGGGVTTIQPAVITPAMLAFTPMTYYEVQISLSSAQILLLNGTPQTIIASPGSGFYIEVIAASSVMTFVSAAYTTNVTMQLLNVGADIAQLQDAAALIATVTKTTKFVQTTPPTAGQTQILPATALQLKVASGNPAVGDGTLKVHVIYRIVTV